MQEGIARAEMIDCYLHYDLLETMSNHKHLSFIERKEEGSCQYKVIAARCYHSEGTRATQG